MINPVGIHIHTKRNIMKNLRAMAIPIKLLRPLPSTIIIPINKQNIRRLPHILVRVVMKKVRTMVIYIRLPPTKSSLINSQSILHPTREVDMKADMKVVMRADREVATKAITKTDMPVVAIPINRLLMHPALLIPNQTKRVILIVHHIHLRKKLPAYQLLNTEYPTSICLHRSLKITTNTP